VVVLGLLAVMVLSLATVVYDGTYFIELVLLLFAFFIGPAFNFMLLAAVEVMPCDCLTCIDAISLLCHTVVLQQYVSFVLFWATVCCLVFASQYVVITA
jgi:hypothetical protein